MEAASRDSLVNENSIKTSNEDSSVYFVTGATGLMGSEFISEVLESSNSRCILLVRADDENGAEQRLDSLIRYLYPEEVQYQEMRKRVSYVMGDVSLKQLGMSASDWKLVSESTHYILHAAALTDWGASYADSSSVNINGVKEVLRLAICCEDRLKKLIHISSAYVTGSRSGHILPDDLGTVDEACDNYQRSKREGEILVREAWKKLPISIVRPGAVVGNSDNGRTIAYKTFYYPLQLLYNGLPLVLPVSKKGNLEAVPSNWSAKIMNEMMLDDDTNGKCYHLTSGSNSLTNAKLKKIVYKVFKNLGEKPKTTVYVPYFLYHSVISKIIKKKIPKGNVLDSQIRLYRHYMTYKRNFDNTDTLKYSDSKNIPLPVFENYLPTLMNFAIDDRWSQKRKDIKKRKESLR